MKSEDLGIDVEQVRDDWALSLMERGIIVKLSISRWRATTALNYDELGISFDSTESQEFMTKYVTLGHEKLLPPRMMRDITAVEQRARNTLAAYSFDTVWGKFVPYSAFASWKAEDDEVREDFFTISRIMGETYDDIVLEVKAEYTNMATDVWNRLYPDGDGIPAASFLENFTSRIIDKIPDRDEIVSSFRYSTTFFEIPLPSFIEADITKRETLAMERESKAQEHLICMETRQIIAEDYRTKKRELVDSFLTSTVDYLRRHIAELAKHTYDVLKNSERDVNLAHVKKLKSMIKKVENLNFHNDEEMKQILDDLYVEVSKYKGDRDKKIITNKLRELVDLSKKEYMPEGYNPLIDFADI